VITRLNLNPEFETTDFTDFAFALHCCAIALNSLREKADRPFESNEDPGSAGVQKERAARAAHASARAYFAGTIHFANKKGKNCLITASMVNILCASSGIASCALEEDLCICTNIVGAFQKSVRCSIREAQESPGALTTKTKKKQGKNECYRNQKGNRGSVGNH